MKKKFKTNERAGSVPLFHDFNESQEQQWVYEMKNLFLATLSLLVLDSRLSSVKMFTFPCI